MKAFGRMTMLCLENEGMKRPSSKMLLTEMKQVEASLLEGGMAAETEANNVQLAMWRMQKAVQKKESEIANVNEDNQSMQSNISRLTENARWLEQHQDRLHLESQMQESALLDVSSSGDFTTVHTGSEADPLLASRSRTVSENGSAATAVADMGTASSGRCQSCFRQGKCACCLFTSMVILSAISIAFALATVSSIADVNFGPYVNCSCSFPNPATDSRLLVSAAIAHILLPLALTTALIVRFLLWCRGDRRQGLTLICSPAVILLTALFCTFSGIVSGQVVYYTPSVAFASTSSVVMGLAVLCILILLQWLA